MNVKLTGVNSNIVFTPKSGTSNLKDPNREITFSGGIVGGRTDTFVRTTSNPSTVAYPKKPGSIAIAAHTGREFLGLNEKHENSFFTRGNEFLLA